MTRGVIVAVALALAASAAPGAAQVTVAPDEAHLLREAAALEAGGRMAEAEERIRALLEEEPGSAAGVFALERVLRAQDRVEEVLPAAEASISQRPDGSAVRILQLRVLAEVDSLDALRSASRRWIDRDPTALETYREVIRVYERALGPKEALAVVTEARRATGRPRALPVVAGDLKARAGDTEGAVSEWGRAVGEEGTNLPEIVRRVEGLPGERTELVGALIDDLTAEPTTPERLRAAAQIGVDAGLPDRAIAAAEAVLPRLDPRTRRGFLVEWGRNAEEEGSLGPALWAYDALRREAEGPGEARALDERMVELTLRAGDTARAVAAQERIVESLGFDADDRRRPLARLIRLQSASGRLDPALERIGAFREAFREAPELDGLAAGLARVLSVAGRTDEALAVVEGVEGPESALERAHVHLARDEIAEADEELRRAAEGLEPGRATGVIEILALLGGASSNGRTLAAGVAGLAHRGDVDGALRTLDEGLSDVPVDDRPRLLALGARIADGAGRPDAAAGLRIGLIEEYPESVEAAEATVRLARFRARDPEGVEAAARMLEELIVNRPESAVVPEARRELQRLRGRIPGGGER